MRVGAFIITALKGVAIGIANAIPGVSGGTMAVILKIYDQMLAAIDLNLKKLRQNWRFLLALVCGMGVGILLTAKVLSWFFEVYYVPTQLFFVGVILGSIPMILREVRNPAKNGGAPVYGASRKNSPGKMAVNMILFVAGAALVVGISFLNGKEIQQAQADFTIGLGIYLLFALFLAAVAMIIPGLSGSFVLLLLGGYQTVISAVNDLFQLNSLLILGFGGVGILLGLLLGAKAISWLLARYRQATYCCILGLICGSLYAVFPAGFQWNAQGIAGIFVMIIGGILPTLMERIGSRPKNV